MRTGVLADDVGRRKFTPLTQQRHDEYFRRPHLHTHDRYVKPSKNGRERTSMRSLTPHATMVDYGNLLNPLNVKSFVEAFGTRLDNAPTYEPPAQFQTVVGRYNDAYPMFSTDKEMNPATAYFVQKISEETNHEIDMGDYFVTAIKGNPSGPKMRRPLSLLVEKEHNVVAAGDIELQTKIKALFEEAMRLSTVQPTTSGAIDRSAIASIPPPPPRSSSPDRDRDRSPGGRRPDFQYARRSSSNSRDPNGDD